MKKQTYGLLAVLALGHGLNDFIAGLLLARTAGSVSALWDISLFTLYSIIAFGGQVPLALLIEKKARYRNWTLAGFALMAVALFIHSWDNVTAILISGIASAIYHVAGGAISIRIPEKQSIGAGLFSAPGVIGLAAGGFIFGKAHFSVLWLLPAVALFAFIVFRYCPKTEPQKTESWKTTPAFDWHDGLMILLLLIIALRSAVWDIFQLVYYESPMWMLWIALAAAAGKLIGGLMAERFNKVNYISASLLSSLVLLQFSPKHPAFLLGGIALLQSTLPACVVLFNRFLGNQPAMSNAVVLGLAIVLGSFPYQFPDVELFYWIGGTLSLLVLLFWFIKRKVRSSLN